MQFSQGAINLIKEFEGFRAKPYLDSVSIPTIGYGTTVYENGKKVSMKDAPVTEKRAEELLLSHLNTKVLPHIKVAVTVPLTQNQIDALGCFIYNIGAGAFKNSTLLKKINAKAPLAEIEEQWLRWNKASGKVLAGLTRRRESEFSLYKK